MLASPLNEAETTQVMRGRKEGGKEGEKDGGKERRDRSE